MNDNDSVCNFQDDPPLRSEGHSPGSCPGQALALSLVLDLVEGERRGNGKQKELHLEVSLGRHSRGSGNAGYGYLLAQV